jgi:hypothetical protein
MQESYGIEALMASYAIDSGCKTGGKDGKEGKEGKDDGIFSQTTAAFHIEHWLSI